ncbi:hypothetical protein MMC30_005128 [Trapelia coarctata]|nr:hypothetical protein [Trapelia coarctata]
MAVDDHEATHGGFWLGVAAFALTLPNLSILYGLLLAAAPFGDKVLPTTTTLANKVEELERAVKEQTAIAEAANKRAETAEQRADDEKQRAEKTISDLAAAIKAAVEAAVAGIRGETTAAVTAVVAGEVERTAAAVAAAVEMVVVRERARGEEALAKQGEAMVVNMVLFN